VLDVCSDCHGLWLDRGKIYDFSTRPDALEKQLDCGLRDERPSEQVCPRCNVALVRGKFPEREAEVGCCRQCGGLWFDADELERAVQGGPGMLGMELPTEQEASQADPQVRARAEERLRDVAAGLLALPNLFLRSALMLTLLYGILGLVLVTLVQFGKLSTNLAVFIGVTFAALQFGLGPWLMDLSLAWAYAFRWVTPGQLPEHLREFVTRVCNEQHMSVPRFGLIDDGAPTAFTYGHHPNNARVVISRGILELLTPEEVEAVVAHELGHACHWDMALMTMANLVPLLLYYVYRIGIDFGGGKKDRNGGAAVAAGAYALYVVSEYIVLWFSRTREYFADRFAGQATGNPNALASALVKIAYGLAAQDSTEEPAAAKKAPRGERIGALRALNIFDQRAAAGLVMASATDAASDPRHPDVEQVKSAMQWDLWNPWARFYELNSTHPLVARRLMYLTDQAAHLGQEPLVVFDRRKPQSYWDDFLVDVSVMALPTAAFMVGMMVAIFAFNPFWLFVGVAVAGIGSLLKTSFAYRCDFFPHLSVAALLHKVKVSAVRPVPATLTGTIIGKGVPGLVWSKDFVLKDHTGLMFLGYRQPLAIWEFLFGLFRAGNYQGKEVRVSGWFRRAPVPYLEVNHAEVLDGSLPSRHSYTRHGRYLVGALLVIVGIIFAMNM
jgi:Zn-dependent protease with chaperone function